MRWSKTILTAVGLTILLPIGALAQESFPAQVERVVGARKVKMFLTGSAIRKKSIIKIYAIGSYLESGAQVRSAEELAAADVPKQLHLILLRPVSGSDMADTFIAVTRQNYPAPAFNHEINMLTDLMRSRNFSPGEQLILTHIPKVGLEAKHEGKQTILIRNPRFSQAMWENYFGRNNVAEEVKRGLISRLPGASSK